MLQLGRSLAHIIFRTGQYRDKKIQQFAKKVRNKKILEIGSGKKVHGLYSYSVKRFFHPSNTFIQSDINPDFGHKVIDVTNMKIASKYEVIICANVLEHVFHVQLAVSNVHKALRKNGTAVFFVPMNYPLHDEPHDYWRFTEHALSALLNKFRKVKIEHSGLRRYPFAYYIEAVK